MESEESEEGLDLQRLLHHYQQEDGTGKDMKFDEIDSQIRGNDDEDDDEKDREQDHKEDENREEKDLDIEELPTPFSEEENNSSLRFPQEEDPVQIPSNFFPKKKFSCVSPAPSIEEITRKLENVMKIDEDREHVQAEMKKDFNEKVDEAKEKLNGKAFQGSEYLEGKALSDYNARIDANYAAIRSEFVTRDDMFIPREKIDLSHENPWVDFSSFREVATDSTIVYEWANFPGPLLSFVTRFLPVQDQCSAACVNNHWNNTILWYKMAKIKQWPNPFKNICKEPPLGRIDTGISDSKSLSDIPRLPVTRIIPGVTSRTRKRDGGGSLVERLDRSLGILFGQDQPLLFHQNQLKGLFEGTERQAKCPKPSKMMEVDIGAEDDTKLHSSKSESL